MSINPILWEENFLKIIDQRVLPQKLEYLELKTWQDVHKAIADMAVRGAPAIGVVAAYGIVLASKTGENLEEISTQLISARPTAINLMWAIDRMMSLRTSNPETLLTEAKIIQEEDIQMNQAIGEYGANLVPAGSNILTICNTGSLATAGYGTALGIIRTAHKQGKINQVFSCETRPRMQGLKLTAWELLQDKIPFQSIVDSAATSLMKAGKIQFVVAGADRIASNGDSANKIGTLMLAVCAKYYQIPFVIAAPSSTIDPKIPNGNHIPIEERDSNEITKINGNQVAPDKCLVYNPAFDVTDADLITHIVTEEGSFIPPYNFSNLLVGAK